MIWFNSRARPSNFISHLNEHAVKLVLRSSTSIHSQQYDVSYMTNPMLSLHSTISYHHIISNHHDVHVDNTRIIAALHGWLHGRLLQRQWEIWLCSSGYSLLPLSTSYFHTKRIISYHIISNAKSLNKSVNTLFLLSKSDPFSYNSSAISVWPFVHAFKNALSPAYKRYDIICFAKVQYNTKDVELLDLHEYHELHVSIVFSQLQCGSFQKPTSKLSLHADVD